MEPGALKELPEWLERSGVGVAKVKVDIYSDRTGVGRVGHGKLEHLAPGEGEICVQCESETFDLPAGPDDDSENCCRFRP